MITLDEEEVDEEPMDENDERDGDEATDLLLVLFVTVLVWWWWLDWEMFAAELLTEVTLSTNLAGLAPADSADEFPLREFES